MKARSLMWLPHARGGVSPRCWFLILLLALALCGEHVSGQREKDSFYKWRDREASDKRLLDMQVQALTKGEPKLLEESPKDEEFVRIAKSITAQAIVPLRQNKAVFNVDAASAFGIVIQSGASKLISDKAATDDKIRASGFKIEGMVVWMLGGASVAITLELFERAYDAFCPLYPFC